MDQNLEPQAFVDVVERELGREFAKHIGLASQLDLLVPYLAEEAPKLISLAKLKLALNNRKGAAPLQQHGAEAIHAYQQDLRDQLAKVATPAKGGGELQALVKFLNDRGLGLAQLVGAQNSKQADEVPLKVYRQGLQ